MATLQIRDLPEDIYLRLVACARAEHRSVSQQATVELRKALNAPERDRSRQALAALRVSNRRLPVGAMTPEALIREDRDTR